MHSRIAQLVSLFESGHTVPTEPMPVLWQRADSGERPRVAVVLHAHYPDVAVALLRRIDELGVPFDVFATTSRDDVTDALTASLPSNVRSFTVFSCDNIGRDVLPLVRTLATADLSTYAAVLKVHTKKTVGQTYGEKWRDEIVDALLPEPAHRADFLARLDDPRWGILAPSQFLLTNPRFWGANRRRVNALRTRFAYRGAAGGLSFVAGTMFWFRTTAFTGLDRILDGEAFENERGQLDGTLAHALERIFADLSVANGLTVESSNWPYRDLLTEDNDGNNYPGAH